MSQYLLAIDQGTTSTRAMLFSRDGDVLAREQQELPQHYPQEGWVEHDAMRVWADSLQLSRQALAGIDLAGIAEHVTLLEFMPELKADAVLQKKLASLPNVEVILNAQTTEVLGDGSKVNALAYKDRATGEEKRVELEGIFVQIGLLPNTDWLKGTVELSKFGEIVIDAKGQTSIPGVFAAGDCTTVPYKQIIIAAGAGATAALGAFDHLIRTSA